jgi:Flp pilus assembly protein TadG
MFNLLHKREDGSVVVVVALFMTVLIGFAAFAIDLGLKYNTESKLQRGLDSVALAAVRELPSNSTSSTEWINAKKAALKYAELNEIANLAESDILPVSEGGKIIGVTVKGNSDVTFNFASVLGVDSVNVKKEATAKLMKVSGVSGLLPLAMPKAVMDIIEEKGLMGQDLTLKLGPQKLSDLDEADMRDDLIAEFDIAGNSGWRGAINFLDDSLKTMTGGGYKDAMENGGFDSVVNIGDPVETNSGTMPVNVADKIVIGQAATVPVVEKDAYGVLRVVGFVTFKVTNLQGNSDGSKKVSILTSSYVDDYIVSGDSESGVVLNDYGVRAAKLVDY